MVRRNLSKPLLMICLASLGVVVFGLYLGMTRPTPQSSHEKSNTEKQMPTIAIVMSYDDAYIWQRDIKESILSTLSNQATPVFHNLDTLGVSEPEELERRGRIALEWINTVSPDAVIIADDNAMRYVAVAGADQIDVPIVFCGVNWPADSYDLPREGISGMVEMSPIVDVLHALQGSLSPGDHAVIIGADRPTDRAQARGFVEAVEAHNLKASVVLVKDFNDWKVAFKEHQESAQLLYILNSAGIESWNDTEANDLTHSDTRTITVTEYPWMGQYALLSAMKRGQEQGEWAALEALRLCKSSLAYEGAIVMNREFDYSVNQLIAQSSDVVLPEDLLVRLGMN